LGEWIRNKTKDKIFRLLHFGKFLIEKFLQKIEKAQNLSVRNVKICHFDRKTFNLICDTNQKSLESIL